jgi:hypothetical protein
MTLSVFLFSALYAGTCVATEEPVDAILAAYDEHAVVALSELHWNEEIHEVLRDVVRDPRFLELGIDVVVEFATAFHQGIIDRYVAGEDVTVDELRSAWRDVAVSPNMTWDAPVYELFFATVREVNLAAEATGKQGRIRILAGDPPLDWAATADRAQLLAFYEDPELERDAHFARVVGQQVLAKGRRALLISGGGHLTRRNLWVEPAPNPSPDTTTVHLLRDHPGSVFVIFTLGSRFLENVDLTERLGQLAAPSVVPLDGHWLGAWPASDFMGVRRYQVEGPGQWPFEGLAFAEVADAALYLGPSLQDSLPAFDHEDPAYRSELNRRRRMLGAPEHTRADDGIEQVWWFVDAGRIDEAVDALERIKSWDLDADATTALGEVIEAVDAARAGIKR